MSRVVRRRFLIEGTVMAEAPVHVGGAGEGLATDMPLARDGQGRYYLPGPSLAGAIRAELSARGVRDHAIWGGKSECASFVVVHDAPADSVRREVRDSVRIERRSATADAGGLFSREGLSRGTRFAIRIEIDDDTPAASAQGESAAAELLARRMAAILRYEGLAVGAATSAGFGRVRALQDESKAWSITLDSFDLATPAGFLAWLRGAGSPVTVTEADLPVREQTVTVTLPWRSRGPILVSRSMEGAAVDTVPMTSPDGAVDRLVIPGSSIKGCLRAQAERIVATMDPAGASRAVDALAHLFGLAGKRGESGSQGRRGCLVVSDVRCTRAIPQGITLGLPPVDEAIRTSNDYPDDAKPRNELVQSLNTLGSKEVKGPKLLVGDHVAIDRWTGGAVAGALYSVLEPWQMKDGDWDHICIGLDLWRIKDSSDRAAAQGLLALVLMDLCDSRFGIGFGTARGYGSVAASAADATWVGSPSEMSLAALLTEETTETWVKTLWSAKPAHPYEELPA